MAAQTQGFQKVSQSAVAFLGTDPVPASAYFDPDWFELERKAIFMRTWLEVGHICEVPEAGSFIRRELEFAKASLLIVRGRDDQIRAFHNVCTHRGTQLVDAAHGRKSTFSCPYHMWTYGLDGALISAPELDQFHVEKADCALPEVALAVCAGLIFINLDKNPEPFKDWINGLDEELEKLPVAHAVTFSEYAYEIDANWKLTYDNFQENYHLRFIHPRTGLATFSADNPYGYPAHYGFHGLHRTQTIWSNPDPKIMPIQRYGMGKAVASAMHHGILGLPNDRNYFALFPNFFILGSAITHFSHVVYPLAANKSRGVIRLYWASEDANASERFAREFTLAMTRDVHTEDRAVIAAGQRGLDSGALDHIHFQTQEALCRHLYNGVRDSVAAWQSLQESAA